MRLQISAHARRLLLMAAVGTLLVVAGRMAATWWGVTRRLERVRADFALICEGVGGYGVDIAGLAPPDTSLRREGDPSVPLTFEWESGYAHRVGKAKAPGSIPPTAGSPLYNSLTTPVRYAKPENLRDPFRRGAQYGYASWNWNHDGLWPVFILHSPGPDGRDDRDLVALRREVEALLMAQMAGRPDDRQGLRLGELLDLVVGDLYDPTNGTRSRGDLIMFSCGGMERVGFGAE